MIRLTNHEFGGPAAGIVNSGVEPDGANGGGSAWLDGGTSLDDRLKGPAQGGGAALKQRGGMDVTVDGGWAGEPEIPGDALGAAPAHEGALDVVALGMMANGAFTGVARAARGKSGWPVGSNC